MTVNKKEIISNAYKVLVKTIGVKNVIRLKYLAKFGRILHLKNPKSLNEKLNWLKIYGNEDFHTTCADKYAVRKYLSDQFGNEYLVPLVFWTRDVNDINPDKLPDYPCVIKNSTGCGDYQIIRDKTKVDYEALREKAKWWLRENHYWRSQEWQYKNIEPRIMVEKLLLTSEGKLPNDYKLHFFNGRLELIYCSVDREGKNYRLIYNPKWELQPFVWIDKRRINDDLSGPEIEPPRSLTKMIGIGTEVAKRFKYVRVDFYDVDGQLYYGEITLHHGGGMDLFNPDKYDYIYGEKLNLN